MEKNMEEINSGGDSNGPVVGSIIIIIIIIVGGLYFWSKVSKPSDDDNMTPEEILGAEDENLNKLRDQSSSDEIIDIEADLNSSNFTGLDNEINNIESELDNL